MKKVDKFRTANRLAAAMELNKPRDEREEMRPIPAAEVRVREGEQVRAKRYLQLRLVEDVVAEAFARIIYPADYGRPTQWDANVLIVMSDDDIRAYSYPAEKQDRLIRFRDALRARDLTVWEPRS